MDKRLIIVKNDNPKENDSVIAIDPNDVSFALFFNGRMTMVLKNGTKITELIMEHRLALELIEKINKIREENANE